MTITSELSSRSSSLCCGSPDSLSWRIAVPLQGNSPANPVASAKNFSFYVASGRSGKVCHEDDLPAPENRPDLWPLWLVDKLVDVVVVHRINDRLKSTLEQAGILVFLADISEKDPQKLAAECYHQNIGAAV